MHDSGIIKKTIIANKTRLRIQRPVKIQKLLARKEVTLLRSTRNQRQILI